MNENERKDVLLDRIADLETDMFLAMRGSSGPSPAQEKPEIFRLTRHMAHAAHGSDFLESWLGDLEEAKQAGRNLLEEKYARAAGDLPLSSNPVADAIADVEAGFLEQAGARHPEILKGNDAARFRNYLRQDLEGLSSRSLELYARELEEAARLGRNPAIERHNWLAAKLGRPLLPE